MQRRFSLHERGVVILALGVTELVRLGAALAVGDFGHQRVVTSVLDVLPVGLGLRVARLRLRQCQGRLIDLCLGLALGGRETIARGLQAGLSLIERGLGGGDVFNAAAGLHLRQRALGRVARGLGLDDLDIEFLRVRERLEGIFIGLGRAVAPGTRLVDLGLGGRDVLGAAAGLEQRQVGLGHRDGGASLIALGLQQGRVELHQDLVGGHLLAFVDQERLDAPGDLAGDHYILGLDCAGAAQRVRARCGGALAPPPVPAAEQGE